MPTLRELVEVIAQNSSLDAQDLLRLETKIRQRWPRERIYILPIDSPRDTAKKAKIKQAGQRLPTRVVAERFNVSESWVRRVIKSDG